MSDKRNRLGQFSAGNKGGPGRPCRTTESDLLMVMSSVVTPTTWKAITRKAVDDALDGDHRSRDWLARYLAGTPNRIIEILPEEVEEKYDYTLLSDDELAMMEKLTLKLLGKE